MVYTHLQKIDILKLVGYILGNTAIAVVCFGIFFGETFLGNAVAFTLILFALGLSGRVVINVETASIFFVATMLYFLEPGPLFPLVALIPLLGLFFDQDPVSDDCFKNIKHLVIGISLMTIITVNTVFYIGYLNGENFVNIQSEFFLYILLLNVFFLKTPLNVCVAICVFLCFVINPHSGGNRSSLFLLIFLLNRQNFMLLANKQNFTFLQKYSWDFSLRSYFFKITFLLLLLVIAISLFFHPTMTAPFQDNRLEIWSQLFIDIYSLDYDELRTIYFEEEINPHNSFIFSMLFEGYVGFMKSLIFLLSIFFIPVYVWAAIFLRSTFDSFFLVGPLGIFFFAYVRMFMFKKF